MAWTRHNHHIPNSPEAPKPLRPTARCGGVRLCKQCKDDAGDWSTAYNSAMGRSQ